MSAAGVMRGIAGRSPDGKRAYSRENAREIHRNLGAPHGLIGAFPSLPKKIVTPPPSWFAL
jgi:hypothetical protein